MTQSNTSSPRGSKITFEFRGRWQLKSLIMKRFLEEGGTKGKKGRFFVEE